jgi:hypothetical protein
MTTIFMVFLSFRDIRSQRRFRGSRLCFALRSPVAAEATLLMWFSLRSPELAEDFERLMAGDRDIVRGSLDTVSEWRLTRPLDLPGQSIGAADYVLIAELVEIERWQEQETELIQHLEDDLGHLVSSRGMLVLGHVL